MNSFLPNAVKEWNKLPIAIRQSTTMNIFKSKLSKLNCPTKPPDYYNTGSRQGQIHHARLRMQTSDLNDHLVKRYISNDPSCECGAQYENPEHYLLFCPRYSHERINLRNKIQTLDITDTNVTDTLLSGNQALSENVNRSLFKVVTEYIVATKRFSRQ